MLLAYTKKQIPLLLFNSISLHNVYCCNLPFIIKQNDKFINIDSNINKKQIIP